MVNEYKGYIGTKLSSRNVRTIVPSKVVLPHPLGPSKPYLWSVMVNEYISDIGTKLSSRSVRTIVPSKVVLPHPLGPSKPYL